MTEVHEPHYIPRDNLKASARPLGQMIVSGEATINETGGISVGENEVMPPHSFRISIEEDNVLNVRIRGKN